MSITLYPKTNEHTKWVNHVIEDMLQHHVNPWHDDWDEFLGKVGFTYND